MQYIAASIVPRNLDYRAYAFNFNAIAEADCIQRFRFKRVELLVLMEHMDLNETFRTRERTKFTGIEGLCLLCERLAFPVRLYTLESKYGRSEA